MAELRNCGIAGLVLAAGAGTRFGGRKQLALIDGRPLLQHAVEAMSSAGLARVIVVLGAHADEIQDAITLDGVGVVVCDDWEEGQAASLRAGVAAAAAHADAVVVTLGDQPRISSRAIAAVAAAEGTAARATYDGKPGHPVKLDRSLFPALLELRGDVGAREVLKNVAVTDVPCDGLGTPDDIDLRTDLR
jgi:CTP:molybdopterin cytidylyltransferase MocA